MALYVRKTTCPYDCPTSCGLLAETDGTRISSVRGDPDHPAAKGLICRKMRRYEQSIHSSERILTPMKRMDAKGEGEFEPVTWDAAVKEIAGGRNRILEEDGADAILPMYYSGVVSALQCECGDAFFNRMGACDMVRTLCSSAKGAGYEVIMGQIGYLDPRELSDSSFYLVWGSSMKATRLQSTPALIRAHSRGKRVMFIESCAADMGVYCDQTILIRPGTDGVLALAMMYVMEEENPTDRDFLAHQTEGYEAFRKTLSPCTPAWAEREIGIPAEVIADLAKEYASAAAPAIILGSGPSRYGNDGMITRLITILSAYTGAWGRPGGSLCSCNPGAGPHVGNRLVTRPDFRKKPGRRVNINEIASAFTGNKEEKPIRSFYVYGGNPVASVCCQKGIMEGLLRPDLLTVVHERFMTDTVMYADILLPAVFSTGQTDVYTAYGYCTFGTTRKIIEPAGQSKSNWNTFCLLAQTMGYEEAYFKKTEEEMFEELPTHPTEGLSRISKEEWRILREGGAVSTTFADHGGFRTPSGRMMIYNENMEESMPRYVKCHGGTYSLRLVVVPSAYTLNSVFVDREDLRSGRGPMALILHPEDAATRNIGDGSPVTASNDLVEMEFTTKITPLVAEGTAATESVYDRTLTKDGLLVNALHHGRPFDIGAATTLSDNTVDVEPC